MSKLALVLYMLFSVVFFPILCQNKNIAIVANLNHSGKINRNFLDQLTLMINKEDDINVALIFLNTSTISNVDQMNEVETALAGLKMPYKIITNENDLYQSEEFFIGNNSLALIGINSDWQKKLGVDFIKIESLKKISEEQDLNKFSKVFLFTNNSLGRTLNNSYLLNLFTNKYVFSFYPTQKNFSIKFNSELEIVEIQIPPSITNDEIDFFLLKLDSDTIKILKRNNKNDLLDNFYSISSCDLNRSNVLIEEQTTDSSITKIFEIEYESSSTTQNLISDNRIYTVLDNGLIYLNDFKGKEKFIAELIGTIRTNPALYKDLILAATFEGDVYSINSNNGDILQVVGIGENITSDISLNEFDIGNQKKIAGILGTINGNIFCYDAFTFEQVWKNNITKFPIISKPLVVNDKIIFINSNSSLYCVNSNSGSIIWKYEFTGKENLSKSCSPLSDGKNVFSISSDGNLYAIDLLLGKQTWSANTKEILNQFYISSDKQNIFFLDGKDELNIISSKDGKEIRKINFKKSNLYSFVITEFQDKILVGFSDGSLYVFDSTFIPEQLISSNQIPISSINVISKNEFVVKDINGKITLYKIN